jgi:2-iminobutanoate/2-iminopropanoate deaminase
MEEYMVMKIIKTANAPEAIGPYSQAVEAGGFVFVSGQIPIDPRTGNVVQADVKIQTNQVMSNAREILKAAGCGMQDVVKVTIFLKSMADFSIVNEVYSGFFPADPPARATVEVSCLPKDVAIEMDFVAWKG